MRFVAQMLMFVSIVLALPDQAAAQNFVLAASWQPAFCETAPDKPECKSQTAARYDASHFALHGLWVQSRAESHCGVAADVVAADKAGDWRGLPMAELPEALSARLRRIMPGTMSALDRHEWIKHGTCMKGADPELYFAVSLDLMDHLNASPLRDLFAANIGRRLSGERIREAFEAGFGAGSGNRLRIACVRDGDRLLIREITIGLEGAPRPGLLREAFAVMIAAAAPTRPGCPGGIVDPVGFQ